jgi:hypothetical protein
MGPEKVPSLPFSEDDRYFSFVFRCFMIVNLTISTVFEGIGLNLMGWKGKSRETSTWGV